MAPSMQAALAGVAVLVSLFAPQQVAAQACSGVTGRFSPRMGSGYRSAVIATGLRQPRHIVIDSAGNLLVAEQGTGSVRRLVLRETGDTVCVASSSAITNDRSTNHGISLSADGKTLFTSSLASVTAYPYDATAGTVGAGKVIVQGMSNTGTHPTRAIWASKSDPDIIFVARGSNGNIDTSTTAVSGGRSIIRSFSVSQGLQSAHTFTTAGETVAWGLRNIVGMAEDPVYGGLWSVENGLDDMRVSGRDVHNNNPAERLSYHGKGNATVNKYLGLNFGYPSCVAAWDTANLGANVKVGDLIKADGTPAASPDCPQRAQAHIHLPPHTAPLGLAFNKNATRAYIAFHGSWNRNPPDGYRVMAVDFKDGLPVHGRDSKTASIPVMENSSTGSCPNSCFRPVGVDVDAKNRLYVSSDTSGEIYVVYGA